MSMPHEDILYMSYLGPKRHIHLSMDKRAGQFAAFDALSGFGRAISDTADRVSLEADRAYVPDEDQL